MSLLVLPSLRYMNSPYHFIFRHSVLIPSMEKVEFSRIEEYERPQPTPQYSTVQEHRFTMPVTNTWSKKVHSHGHKSPSLFHSHARLIQFASHCFFKIHNRPTIILPSMTRPPKWYLPFSLLKIKYFLHCISEAQVHNFWCVSSTQTHRHVLWNHFYSGIGLSMLKLYLREK